MRIRNTLVLALACLSASGAVNAFTGQCVLQVDGRTYLNGPCPITLDKGGDFTVGSDSNRTSKYFAMVSIEDKTAGTATGFWNGTDAESHAHDPLGTLTRQGACWVNKRAKVCATR